MGEGDRFNNLSLEKKIGQMFMVGFHGKRLSPEIKDFLNRANIGFIILFSRNFENPAQLISLTNEIHSLGDIQPMIFSDQEGGTVCQFGESLSTFVSPMGISATGNPEYAFEAGRGIGRDLKRVGIDGNIAPVVDVNWEADNPIIGIRAFSDEPDKVIIYAKEFLRGLESAGVSGVLKHFPGHGRARIDSHFSLPEVGASLETLIKSDLKPYFELSKKADFIMSAHISFPSIEKKSLPSTFSEKFGKILREDIGFRGVYMTDCLEMGAIRENFSPQEIVKGAISGGADLLVSSGFRKDFGFQKALFESFVRLVKDGIISEERVEESFKRIVRVKERLALKGKRIKISGVSKVRDSIEKEKEVALSSIVVFKDKLNKIPIEGDKTLGIIEWEKAPSTIPVSEARKKIYLFESAKKYFKEVKTLLLPLKEKSEELAYDFLNSFDEIIVAPYSRYSQAEKIQGKAISNLLRVRDDIIVVSLGNPYDIRCFPSVKEYICTFGFRKVQLEALFEILMGKKEPEGRMPVKIAI